MKKILLSLCLVFLSVMGFSQAGLDGIIVEKYYKANAADHAKDNTLPVGAVTYRIYVDMKPDWILQAINGSPSFNQRLQFKTTTSFFNETVSGDADAFGHNIKYTSLKNGLLMLDSWISMGAAAKTSGANIYYGVPKADDDAVGQIVNTDPTVLQNTSGYPAPFVKDRDGIRTVATPPLPAIGQSPTLAPLVTMLNGGPANDFTTTDATWFTSDNCTGPDPATNKVLIGQFTTDGEFTFRINIQIKNPTTSVVEKYVNENPGTGQFLRADLAQTLGLPATPPVVSILSVLPLPNTYTEGAVVTILAHATDNVSVSKVEFFTGSTSIGLGTPTATPGDYRLVWTSTPTSGPLTAVATDNEDTPATSASVPITVASLASYLIPPQSVSCNNSDFFYVPVVTASSYTVKDVIGFDMVMKFNNTKVRPTGVIRVNNDLITNSIWTSYNLRVAGDSMFISLYLNGNAPASTYFHTINTPGQVLAVEFAKTTSWLPSDNAEFSVNEFVESYNSGTHNKSVSNGTFATYAEHLFTGSLKFWADNSPITYTGNPSTSLITNIIGNTPQPLPAGAAVQPDAIYGNFIYDINNGLSIEILRDINPDTAVMSVINGYDAYLTQKVLVNDPSFIPNVFQIMAMDVNRDGKVSAGDVTQINQRTVKMIPEFKQKWNYNDDGTKITGMGASFDWLFADNSGIIKYASCRKSNTYPNDDGIGYSKNRVPAFPVWLTLPVEYPIEGYACPNIRPEDYIGIMLGDINGNYKNIDPLESPGLKKGIMTETGNEKTTENAQALATDKIVVDLSNATLTGGYLTFPISVSSEMNVNSLDFSLKFDMSKLTFKSVMNNTGDLQSLAYFNEQDQTLRITSFSMKNYPKDAPVISLRFEKKGGEFTSSDLSSIKGYLNGNQSQVELSKLVLTETPLSLDDVKVYPNPARGKIYVELKENGYIKLIDMYGRVVLNVLDVNAYQKHEINIAHLGGGTYMMKIYMKVGSDELVTTKKIVIKK